MNYLLKNGLYALMCLTILSSCSKDDDEDPAVIGAITITTATSGDGTILSVTPTASGATSFSVDFGTDATDDVKTTVGPAVTYDYPNNATATDYTVTVTASATGSASKTGTKIVTITFAPPSVLMNFEDAPTVAVTFAPDPAAATALVTATIADATAEGTTYGKVGKIVYPAIGTGWQSVIFKPAKYVDLSTESTITMDIYLAANTAAIPVTLKMQGIKTGGNAEAWTKIEKGVMTTATTTAEWQTLSFDLSTATKAGDGTGTELALESFDTMALFIGVTIAGEGGPNVAGTYEIDNIAGAVWGTDVPDTDGDGIIDNIDKCPTVASTETDGCPPAGSAVILPTIDFESFDTDTTPINNFDGGVLTVETNPQSLGINTSSKVGKMVKSAGAVWGGSTIELVAPIDLSTAKKKISMKVYIPAARTGTIEDSTSTSKVLLKLENLTNGKEFVEVLITTVITGWQTLTFDYTADVTANPTNSYQKVVIIFENGTVGAGGADWTFLVDDITQID